MERTKKNIKKDVIEQFCETLLRMDEISEVKAFLKDVCTPKELEDLSERWNVCLHLNMGKSYRAISKETGVSLATITRVARFLKDEPYKGYKMALGKLKENEVPRNDENL
ncbi:MAG: trp operon repressor [Holosporales bacterium]|jgi:TrpR-related protein YerC/YecD|nr:trp operon repressor [Holosporales bacterium]